MTGQRHTPLDRPPHSPMLCRRALRISTLVVMTLHATRSAPPPVAIYPDLVASVSLNAIGVPGASPFLCACVYARTGAHARTRAHASAHMFARASWFVCVGVSARVRV
jgi:hypothetical protein